MTARHTRTLGIVGAALLAAGCASGRVEPAPHTVAPLARASEPAAPPVTRDLSALPLMERPMASAWTVHRAWDDAAESEYSAFVTAIGRAVARRHCRSLNACLNDPAINPLHEPDAPPLAFSADCADVPYILRGYFAYRRGLPFAFTTAMSGDGRDPRYLANARAEGLTEWTAFPTPRALFETVGDTVHSGMLRTAPGIEPSDFYQAAIRPGGVRPGTVYYDPNGHVLVVYDVKRNGDVLLFDGHVGGGLTARRFGSGFVLGSARLGGGFKNFRAVRYQGGACAQASDAEIADYGGDAQFERAHRGGFAQWVQACLRAPRARRHAR